MAPKGFKLAGRGRRQIKGSIGGGGGVRVRSKGRSVGDGGGKTGGTPTPPGGTPPGGNTPPTVPDFTKNPLTPWDSNTPIGQLFNQGLYKLPSLDPVTNLLDPRLQGVSGDSMLERRDTYNRIAAAQRPATSPSDPRILKTGVGGDSMRERMGSYNRISSGRSKLQRPAQLARMGGTQRGSAVARAGSASLRAGAAQARAAAPARTSSAGSAPRAAAPRAASPSGSSQPSSRASVASKAPAPVKRKSTTARKAM